MIINNETVVCDGCGTDVGNGGLTQCVILSRLDETTGMVDNLHLCLDQTDADNNTTKGCASKTLTNTRLAWRIEYDQQQAAASAADAGNSE